METPQRRDGSVRGCVLLIPSDLFRVAEQEAQQLGLSLEEYILRLLEQGVRSASET
ncbi:MAG TPA: hypothetical protein VLG48_12250 [Candidatus Methylomirabilis sp.]|nr:hypothetical protein [Candidatus Methylomirabilis sp.]